MKRMLAVLLSFCAMAALLSGCAGAGGNKVIKIGIFEALTGDNAKNGNYETLGFLYAHSIQPTVEIGGSTYDVVFEQVDNESNTELAPIAARELAGKGVKVVLGSFGSAVCIAASDTFKEAKLACIAPTSTNPNVTLGNTHFFRLCFIDPFQGTVLAHFAHNKYKAKKAYVIAKLGDDYSVGLAKYFQWAFEELGFKVQYAAFPAGNKDFRGFLDEAKEYGADIFVSPTSSESAVSIIKQAADMGWDKPILAGDTWDSNTVTAAAKGKSLDICITTFYQEGSSPEFDSGFKEWLNADAKMLANNNGNDMISAGSPMGYDTYFTVLEAIKSAGSTDSVAINNAIWRQKYDGVTGHIEFDENGDAIRSTAVVKAVNTRTGEWDFVTTQEVETPKGLDY